MPTSLGGHKALAKLCVMMIDMDTKSNYIISEGGVVQEHPNTQSSLLLRVECRLHGNYASSHTLCGVQTVAAAHAKRAVGFFVAVGRMRLFHASQAGC